MKVLCDCGATVKPRNYTPGSIWVELALWLLFLLPGLLYSIWRLTQRQPQCPVCGRLLLRR